jgi:nucleoside-diphosphate-sugar epimerase
MIGVTGASGFIGQAVMNRLGERGVALDLRGLDVAGLSTMMDDLDAVIHLAGPLPRSAPDLAVEEATVHLAQQVVEAAEAHPHLALVLASTIRVHAPQEAPIDVHVQPLPFDGYGRGKARAEGCFAAAGGTDRHVSIVRLSSVQGIDHAGQARGLVGTFARQAASGCLKVMGDGLAVKDVVHIDVVAAELVRLAESKDKGMHLHLLGGVRCTVLEVARAIAERTGASIEHDAPAEDELSACFSTAVRDADALASMVDDALGTVSCNMNEF